MKKYLVGGAVRDSLLKIPVTEKDWVITGSSPQEMLNIGYFQVGKDFPVFLHPQNHEEHALARTERKSGMGYTGFSCDATPSVTIEEDLYRRDLTINAMAYDTQGNLLDPYNGQQDIKLRLLRHVSHAFHEDPLRVLRVARFAARFKKMNFTIAPETFNLMQQMTQELPLLSSERVWTETKKALITDSPHVYFQVLLKCGALKILFPELYELFKISVNFNQQKFCSKNLGDYTLTKLANLAYLSNNLAERFSMLCCNLGETTYSSHKSVDYYNKSKILSINNLCNRLKIPTNICKIAKIIATYHTYLYDFKILSPIDFMKIFQAFDCWRQPKRIKHIINVNKAHLMTITDSADFLYNQEKLLKTAYAITDSVKTCNIIKDGFTGANIKTELYSRRLYNLSIVNKKSFK